MINTLSKTLGAQEKTQEIRQSPKHEDRNQAVRKIAKKRAHRDDRTLDRTLEESDRTLRSRGSASAAVTERWTGCWLQIDRTQNYSVRSSTERFQSGEITTGHVQWHVTGCWQSPIS